MSDALIVSAASDWRRERDANERLRGAISRPRDSSSLLCSGIREGPEGSRRRGTIKRTVSPAQVDAIALAS